MKKAKLKTDGFTLIELLVVIAIISLLSSIVLASLSTARLKAKDAAIWSQLSSIRAQAEIYYGNHNNTYGVTSIFDIGGYQSCTANSAAPMFLDPSPVDGLLKLIQSIATQVNGTQLLAKPGEAVCQTSPLAQNPSVDVTKWAMAVKGAVAGNFYCVDSSGTSKAYNSTSNPAATAVTGAVGTGAILATAIKCN